MHPLRYGTRLLPLPRALEGLPVLAREEPPPLADPITALDRALDAVATDEPFDRFLAGRTRVGLILPDATRPLPTPLIEGLLERLAGVRVVVRVANGTHRRTTPEEHRRLLGRFFGKLEIGDRSADDPAAHFALAPGLAIDRVAAECDALVLMGPASFHYLAGFGGGGKLVAPGLADRPTASYVHRACLAPEGGRHARVCAGVVDGNPLRERIEEICRLAPPQRYVIPVLDSGYRPIALLAGGREAAFRASCDALLDVYGLPCRRYRTVVACAGGAPYDVDFVQAHKAWEAAAAAVAPGGTIVWIAQCPEGLPPRHRAFLEQHRGAAAMEAALRARFDIAAHTVWAAREKAERLRTLAVTDLPAEVCAALGLEKAESLERALAEVPLDDAALLPFGARFLPLPA